MHARKAEANMHRIESRPHPRRVLARALLFAAAACGWAGSRACADSIVVDGRLYEEVYVCEGAARYYVQIPEDGRVISVDRARVAPEDLVISPNEAHREALRQQWRDANTRGPGDGAQRPAKPRLLSHREEAEARPHSESPAEATLEGRAPGGRPPRGRVSVSEGHRANVAAPSAAPNAAAVIVVLPPAEPQATDGYVQGIRLDDVPLREALDALLRPLNLDYRVQGHLIWISTPGRLRTEPFEEPEVRTYPLEGVGGETLPKVGVANPGAPP